MIGGTLANYRILDKLGEGGMGVVYVAEDTKLRRRVALKMLPAAMAASGERLERFEREARAVASLNHPNIVTIHSVEEAEGHHFLTMELVEGEVLDRQIPAGGMPLTKLFEIAVPLADALAAAHTRGITHRDLKPANIMVSVEGRVKILDFGLAKLAQPASSPGTTSLPTEALTEEGLVVGTVPYMSPEQIEGKPVDHRTDIFSLGVILYQMATGTRPFSGDSSPALMSAILRDSPIPVTEARAELPRHLARIVQHCLEKEPDRRFQSALDVRNELEALRRELESEASASGTVAAVEAGAREPTGPPPRVSRATALVAAAAALLALLGLWWIGRRGPTAQEPGPQPTIAVLPFRSLGATEAIDYLRLAVPDEITTTLSRTPSLAVRPFTTTAAVEPGTDLRAVGRELRAANLVTGQFFREGQRLHLTLEAVDVDGDRLLWRQSFEVPIDDLISLRQRVADEVRSELLPLLGVGRGSVSEGTRPSNQEAYETYLKSLAVSRDPRPNEAAIAMLERAIELDPSYAPAWSELASRYNYDAAYGDGGKRSHERAESAARRSLELDPELVSGAARVSILHADRGELTAAYDTAQELVTRRPDSAEAHFVRSYALRYGGLLEKAGADCEIAHTLDPTNFRFRSCGSVLALLGRFDRALDFYRLDPNSHWMADAIGHFEMLRGNPAAALESWSRLPEDYRYYREGLLLKSCLEGSPELAALAAAAEAEMAAESDPEIKYWMAGVFAFCGQRDPALRLLRQITKRSYCAFPHVDRDRQWDSLREAPEFLDIRNQAIRCRDRFRAHVSAHPG